MILEKFDFKIPANRPFIYASFVSTIDGKIMVKDKGYWPIGTKEDYKYFTNLRTYADAIVDAKNTALDFGRYTIKTINSDDFKNLRKLNTGKVTKPEFIVLTTNPNEQLTNVLKNDLNFKTTILTTSKQKIEDSKYIKIVNIKSQGIHIKVSELINYLNSKKYKHVFIDGGPSLILSLLKEKMLDELHLTIAPKIFGSSPGKTISLAEGFILPKEQIPYFKIKSIFQLDDEVIIRYIAK